MYCNQLRWGHYRLDQAPNPTTHTLRRKQYRDRNQGGGDVKSQGKTRLGSHKLKNARNCVNQSEQTGMGQCLSWTDCRAMGKQITSVHTGYGSCAALWTPGLTLIRRWSLAPFRALLAVESHSCICVFGNGLLAMLLKSVCLTGVLLGFHCFACMLEEQGTQCPTLAFVRPRNFSSEGVVLT